MIGAGNAFITIRFNLSAGRCVKILEGCRTSNPWTSRLQFGSSPSQLPKGRFKYELLLLCPTDKNIVREPLRVIRQDFCQGVEERHVVETKNGHMIINQSGLCRPSSSMFSLTDMPRRVALSKLRFQCRL